jgi:hypothetical protein
MLCNASSPAPNSVTSSAVLFRQLKSGLRQRRKSFVPPVARVGSGGANLQAIFNKLHVDGSVDPKMSEKRLGDYDALRVANPLKSRLHCNNIVLNGMRCRQFTSGGSVEVTRARVMDDDRGGGLLWHELERLGERHADTRRNVEQSKHDVVL